MVVAEVHDVLKGVGQLLRPPDAHTEMAELRLVGRERVPGDGLDDEGRVAGGTGGDERRGREVEQVLVEGDWRGGHGRLGQVVRRQDRED